ncbi:MAG: discoidin domain-containing protein [Pseudomonadota bacterium]
MRELLQPAVPERAALLLRAQLAADVARRTEDSAEPFEGSVDAILCELYRESIFWSRSAITFAERGESVPAPWPSIDRALLGRYAKDPESLTRAQLAADSGSFEKYALLPEGERQSLLPALRGLALGLLAELDLNRRAVDGLWVQRIVRVGLVVAGLGILVGVGIRASEHAEAAHDLAQGKPWRTSSSYGGVTTCGSPSQECPQSPDFFFHTNEELRPWLEIDLGAPQTFSAVRVDNRKDCCAERASPLIVEVSSDQSHWHRVARKDTVFTSWLAKFSPVSARYVRLRIDKRESLHLQRVRVLP